MAKLSIITRAFNRLEYTVQNISSVQINTVGIDYEHIIISQASDDGTKEWLDWISKMPNKWYQNVKVIHSPRNFGDWGGTIYARGFLSEESEYAMQMDNDLLLPYNWANIMIDVLNGFPADAVMLRRRGATIPIGTKRPLKKVSVLGGTKMVDCGKIRRCVACWMCRTEKLLQTGNQYNSCDGFTGSLGMCCKVRDTYCTEVDGFGVVSVYPERYIQREKYPVDRHEHTLFKRQVLAETIQRQQWEIEIRKDLKSKFSDERELDVEVAKALCRRMEKCS